MNHYNTNEWKIVPLAARQNRLVRWGLHLTYILWNCLIFSRCGTSNYSNWY